MALRPAGQVPTAPVEDQNENPVAQNAGANPENSGAGTPNPPVTGSTTRNKDMDKRKYYENFKKDGLALHQAEVESGEAEADGSMRDAVAYLYALGNPAKTGTRTEKGTTDIKTIEVIGYACKAVKEGVKAPICKREGINKTDVMGFSSVEWVDVPVGTVFTLSRAELGEMISQGVFAGMFTGDPDNQVEFGVTFSKVAGNAYAPQALLKTVVTENSKPIKSNIVPVAVKKEGAKGNSLKDYDVLPEYAEKFGYIFAEVQSVGRSSNGGSKQREVGQTAAELAAAFRAYRKNQQKAAQ